MEFKEAVEKAITGAGPDINREELLVDIFKSTIAQYFEWYLINKNNGKRIPFDAVLDTKASLITEFRDMKLDGLQKPIEWYEDLFESTIKEIFEFASTMHSSGADMVTPTHQGFSRRPSGIIIPH